MTDSADHLRKLLREYPWIEGEKAQFGRPGSDYDWEARDPKQVGPSFQIIFLRLTGEGQGS